MMDIKLETNEEIIINSKGVLRVGCSDIYADDLILTNTNIIHIHRNNFGKIKTVERIPVSNIKIENNVPQIHMKKGTNNRWQLYISLIDSIEVFDFSLFPKKEINKWIDALMLLLTHSQSHNLTEVKNEISIVEPQNELSIINKEKSNTIKDYLLSKLKELSPKRKKILLLIFAVLIIFILFSNNSNSNKDLNVSWEEDIVLCDILPEPDSNKIKIFNNSNKELYICISDISEKKYNNYLKECKEAGFIIEREQLNYNYSSFNESGYELILEYNDKKDEITLKLYSPIDMNTIEWSVNSMANILPQLPSMIGKIEIDDEHDFEAYIGNISEIQFNEYINLCIENGFNINTEKSEKTFSAKNQACYTISLEYVGNNVVSVKIKEPIYDVKINLSSDENSLFSTYKMDIILDDSNIGTLQNGESKSFETALTKGEHIIEIAKSGDHSIKSTLNITITKNISLEYDLHSYSGSIDIEPANDTSKNILTPLITDININYESLDIYCGEIEDYPFKLEGQGNYSVNDVLFISENEKIAKIELDENLSNNHFKIIGINEGTTTVYIQSKDKKVTSKSITVNILPSVTTILFDEDDITINLQDSSDYHIDFDYSPSSYNIEYNIFTIISDDKSVVTGVIEEPINSYDDFSCVLTPHKTGETYISVKTNNGITSEKIKVIVKDEKIIITEPTEEKKSGRIVYTTPTGSKYHCSSACAGKNAIEHDYDDVKDYYDPCKKCAW